MKAHISIISLLACGLAITACSGTADNDSISFNQIKSHATYRLAGSAEDYEAASDLCFDCSADILMPTAIYGHKVEALQDSILKAAFDTTGVNHKGIIDAAFRRAAQDVGYAVADTTVADSSYDGLYTVAGVVESLSPSILSYAVTVSEYLPRAAHGMYGTNFVNYDIEEGKVFGLSDIFTAEGLAKLPSILKQTAVSMRDYIGPTELTSLPAGNNFCVNSDNDIIFVYQPYEIASYAQGEIRVPVAAYILSEYFTPYGNKLLMDVD